MKVLVIDPKAPMYKQIGSMTDEDPETGKVIVTFNGDKRIEYELNATEVVDVSEELPWDDRITAQAIVARYQELAGKIGLEISGTWLLRCVGLLDAIPTNPWRGHGRDAIDMRFGLKNGVVATHREVKEEFRVTGWYTVDKVLKYLRIKLRGSRLAERKIVAAGKR